MKPLGQNGTTNNQPDRDLNIDVFSAKLEDEPSPAVRPTMPPFKMERAKLRDPDKDLNNEDFPAKLEAEPSELVSNRNSESCSAILEDSPTEPIKDLARPLIWEVATPWEPERDRNSEFFSVILEVEPRESLRVMTRA